MVRTMCGAKLMEKKRTEDLMEMLGFKETAVQMAKANGVRWYGHVGSEEDTTGEGEQECWFGEGRCHKSSEMESGSWRDCC